MQPDEVVEVPGQPHTFGLAGARQMLSKLEWEVRGFGRNDIDRAFWAFNAAVTAWHLAEWVWPELPAATRARWKNDEGAFYRWCRQECRELELCGLITNGSKHRDYRPQRAQEHVTMVAFADVVHWKWGISGCWDPLSTWTWRLLIRDGERERPAEDVFSQVLEFWRGCIEREILAAPRGGAVERGGVGRTTIPASARVLPFRPVSHLEMDESGAGGEEGRAGRHAGECEQPWGRPGFPTRRTARWVGALLQVGYR